MNCWLFNFAALAKAMKLLLLFLSAAFAAGALILWIGSFRFYHIASIGYGGTTGGVSLQFESWSGAVHFIYIKFEQDSARPALGFQADHNSIDTRKFPQIRFHLEWIHYGFGLQRSDETVTSNGPPYSNHSFAVAVPHWLLLCICAIWPVLDMNQRRVRAKRLAAGLCWKCGYDLRATPDRCPECGTIPTKKGAVAR